MHPWSILAPVGLGRGAVAIEAGHGVDVTVTPSLSTNPFPGWSPQHFNESYVCFTLSQVLEALVVNMYVTRNNIVNIDMWCVCCVCCVDYMQFFFEWSLLGKTKFRLCSGVDSLISGQIRQSQ